MLARRLWLLVLAAAAVALVAIDAGRIHRLDFVAAAGSGGAGEDRPALIVPERSPDTFDWLSQTRQMLQRREWRVRHVDYENAPFGRSVSRASPYRWWLGALDWGARRLAGRPPAAALETAAKLADPVVQVAALFAGTLLTAWCFGPWAAAVAALGLFAIFPLGAAYLPGAPDDRGLACALALLSALLLAGTRPGREHHFAAAAGVLLGLVFWVNVGIAVPTLLGLSVGGLLAAWCARAEPPMVPWRTWSVSGAVTVVIAFFAEYAPAHLQTWQLREVHPLFAIAWLGLAELVILADGARVAGAGSPRAPRLLRALAAVGAVAAVPLVLWRTHDLGFVASDLPALRLARLPTIGSGVTLFSWLRAEGLTAAAWATLLPLLWLAPALWLFLRKSAPGTGRRRLALALGAVTVALVFACRELRSFDLAGAMLIVLAVVTIAGARLSRVGRAFALAGALLALVPGVLLLLPPSQPTHAPLEEAEIYQLIERDLARWLVAHSDPANGSPLVFAPQNLNATFQYYAGIRGLATLGWENHAGLEAAVRIASASTPQESKELIDRRGVTHLIVPSWDPFLDVYARMGMGKIEGTFMERVHVWRLPGWLRPLPYAMPHVAGLESQSVFVFAVVPDPGEAVALSRIGEYFAAIGQLNSAASVAVALRRFPASMAAWVVRGEIAGARQDGEGVEAAMEVLRPRLNAAPVRNLPWDLRVGLIMLLAESHHLDLAREPVRRCLVEATPERLRGLSEQSLFRLLLIGKAFGLNLTTADLRTQALSLLSPELAQRL